MKLLKRVFTVLLVLAFWAVVLCSLNAQSIDNERSSTSTPDSPLPSGPSGQDAQQSAGTGVPQYFNRAYGPLAPFVTSQRLSAEQKWTIYEHQAFGPPALVFPAVGAAIRMANPPRDYPHDWKDGAGAFGRLYGSAMAVQTSTRTASVLAELAFHEDPRYVPAEPGTRPLRRITHAIVFTLFDQTDSGRRTLALSHFAGAAAGGFVGMAYMPDSYSGVSRAGQRATVELGSIGIANVAQEFRLAQRLHLPKIVPAWWVPEHQQHP